MLGLYVKARNFMAHLMEERGAVATEYGLLLVLIALAIVAAATALGLAIAGVFTRGGNSLGGVGS